MCLCGDADHGRLLDLGLNHLIMLCGEQGVGERGILIGIFSLPLTRPLYPLYHYPRVLALYVQLYYTSTLLSFPPRNGGI